jgi:hypothetical protein
MGCGCVRWLDLLTSFSLSLSAPVGIFNDIFAYNEYRNDLWSRPRRDIHVRFVIARGWRRQDARSWTSTGIYLIISSISLLLLYKHGHGYAGRRTVLIYTTSMSLVTIVWFVSNAFADGAMLLREYSTREQCQPLFLLGKITAALQLLGGDLLLVPSGQASRPPPCLIARDSCTRCS